MTTHQGPQTKSGRARPTNVPEALADLALVDARQVAAAAGLGLSKWYQLVASGDAPAPAFTGPRFTRWRLADVRAWLVEFSRKGLTGASGERRVQELAERASAAAAGKRAGGAK